MHSMHCMHCYVVVVVVAVLCSLHSLHDICVFSFFFFLLFSLASTKTMALVMGFEGSANKLGVGIVDEKGNILCNVRHTYITPPGSGFLPRDTAHHHQKHILALVQEALHSTALSPNQLTALAFTKGICSAHCCCCCC